MNVIETLQTELAEITSKLEALDQLKNQRAALLSQQQKIKKAIAMLSGEPVVRKPMSPEAKERIRAGLEKARAAKLAAGTTKPQHNAAPAQPIDSGKKLPVAEKGSGRGAN